MGSEGKGKGWCEAEKDVNQCDGTHYCTGHGISMSHKKKQQTVPQVCPFPKGEFSGRVTTPWEMWNYLPNAFLSLVSQLVNIYP